MNKDCIVVFPVYSTLDEDEIMVLNQAVKMTAQFKKAFVTSYSYQFDNTYDGFKDIEVIRFDDHYFAGIEGYNELMLSSTFYERFKDYKYVLIHQTDAYLFKAELQYWCDKDYDYVGAPWYFPKKLSKYKWYKFLFNYGKLFFRKDKLLRWRHFNIVGNGGLSLRKVSAFIDVLEKVKPQLLNQYLDNNKHNAYFNEDVFWSIEAPKIRKGFNIPGWEVGTYFSVENTPVASFKFMNNTLPFGCHAFKTAPHNYWEKIIPYKIKV